MGGFRKTTLAFGLAGALAVAGLGVSGPAAAYDSGVDDEVTGGEMLADAVAVRPLTFAATVIGTATWIVSLPFTLIGGNTGEAGEKLVVEPFKYTFARPLGYMDDPSGPGEQYF
jgi:hypothetical protein